MLKHLPVIGLVLLLSACSGSKYYFNKRIDHPEREIKQEPTAALEPAAPVEEETENLQAMALVPETAPQEENNVPETHAVQEMEVEDAPITESPLNPQTIQQENKKTFTSQKSPAKKMVQPASAMYVSGWGIVLMVMGGIFLLTVLISLLLGYTIGHALLFGLFAILIVIILLLALAGGKWPDFSNDDDDNDD